MMGEANSAGRDVLIGVDVGGTFTDAVIIMEGRSFRAKSASTYPDIGVGVLAACELAAGSAGLDLDGILPRVAKFGLGTTAVTNVIATRRGLKVGLVTTRGFEETLGLARGRTQEKDGWLKSVDALVHPSAIVGIGERVDRHGFVLERLDLDEVLAAGRYLSEEAGVESIAVSFLWSFLNPEHEKQATALLREEISQLPITSGAELRPVIREYERTSLAVLNAYSMGAYRGIDSLSDTLQGRGLDAPVLLCHSGGGAISIEQARQQPVWLAASGPAAGVTAAARIAKEAGEEKVLTSDLGGTSFDVAHIADGAPARTQRGDIMGFWTALPRVDVESVGAGGGSLAWIDERDMLRVGPVSAGSSPGPVCYARGGSEPALTDALLVLGYLDPIRFLGGRMELDRAGALEACRTKASKLGLSPEELAWGIREIAAAEMTKAVRTRLSSHALAVSEHCLVSYGGCGALFAAEVAKMTGLKRVLIPELASVLSAYGAATMDIRRERLITLLQKLPGDADAIDAALAELHERVNEDLAADGVPEANRTIQFEADMRFFLQRWELTVQLPAQPARGDGGAEAERIFRAEYLRRFGAASTTTSGIVELVGIRSIGIGRMEGPKGGGEDDKASVPGATEPAGSRQVKLVREGEPRAVPLYDMSSLAPGADLAGPALIDAPDTTIWIPAGMTAKLDANSTLSIEVRE